MTIHIEALTFEVIIGLLEHEREIKQTVIIDLKADYTYRNQDFINYAILVEVIKDTLEKKAYTLLEDALLGVKESIMHTYPHIEVLNLKIAKPNILPACSVALSHTWEFKH